MYTLRMLYNILNFNDNEIININNFVALVMVYE